jgi:hypothetical protein
MARDKVIGFGLSGRQDQSSHPFLGIGACHPLLAASVRVIHCWQLRCVSSMWLAATWEIAGAFPAR